MKRLFRTAVVSAFLVACIGLSVSNADAQWRSVPFNAGDFSGDGSMTWTVDEGGVTTFRYVVNDRTMTVAVELQGTSVGCHVEKRRLYNGSSVSFPDAPRDL